MSLYAMALGADDCCTTCDCGRTWCRDLEPNPSEADGICPDCHERNEP